MQRKNLIIETLNILNEHNKTKDDIEWCGIKDQCYFTFNEFKYYFNIDYNYCGFPQINPNLVIVGKDFWLERQECMGQEWWEYKSYPVKPNIKF